MVKNSLRFPEKQLGYVIWIQFQSNYPKLKNVNHAFLLFLKPSPQSGLNNFSINLFVDFPLYRQFNTQTLFSFSYLLLIKKDTFFFESNT